MRLQPPERVLAPREVTGAPVPTSLSLWIAPSEAEDQVQFSIREEQRAPHRHLVRDLVEVTVPRAQVDRAARRTVNVFVNLHRALVHGWTVRLRRAGAIRSAWHVDLLRSGTALCSWPVVSRVIDELDGLDLRLERLAEQGPPAPAAGGLAAYMDQVHADVVRDHEVVSVIRQNLEMPMDELLELLDRRGLLEPV
ncbi:MAG: hypothetical protein QOI31_1893 [Solirubrobacterales bacterium]|nr:hypothetical protein [Solirubrobacterales bacterium]